jgi:hypothetical protein
MIDRRYDPQGFKEIQQAKLEEARREFHLGAAQRGAAQAADVFRARLIAAGFKRGSEVENEVAYAWPGKATVPTQIVRGL